MDAKCRKCGIVDSPDIKLSEVSFFYLSGGELKEDKTLLCQSCLEQLMSTEKMVRVNDAVV